MRTRHFVVGGLLLLGISGTVYLSAQDPSDEIRTGTMRPVIRGRTHAAASMKPEATRAAERILQAGGNAFDAAVAGQAVLGIVDAASNGVGSDAVILVYDAKTKTVVSINAEGTAPKLATIEYQKNLGETSTERQFCFGDSPRRRGRVAHAARSPARHLAQCCSPQRRGRERFPIGERMAGRSRVAQAQEHPTSVKVY
jgi:hypothetical protein